jgi:hypothetical protein
MDKFTLAALSAPVILTATGQAAFAQVDMPPPAIEVVWTESSVITDNSSLSEKITRLNNDSDYRSTIASMANKDLEDGFIMEDSILDDDYSGYVTYLESFTSDIIEPEVVISFGGFSANTPHSGALSDNLSTIEACTDIANDKDITDTYLKHRFVKGCAINALEGNDTAERPKVTIEKGDLQNIYTYVFADPRPIDEKLSDYENDARYYKAVRSDRLDYIELSKSSFLNDIRVWDAVLNPNVTVESLVSMENSFDSRTESSTSIRQNFSKMVECRADILPADLSVDDLTERADVFNEIWSCWKTETANQSLRYGEMDADPFVKASDTSLSQYDTLKQAYADMSLYGDELDAAGLSFYDPTTTNLASNYKYVLECRYDAYEATGGEAVNGDEVAACAFDKASDAHKKYESERAKEFAKAAALIVTPIGLGISGMIGFGAYRRRKQNQIKPN